MPTTTKSWRHFAAEGRKADAREHRATMRSFAMEFREQIAPDSNGFRSFSRRIETAAASIRHAISYRNLAAQAMASARNLEA